MNPNQIKIPPYLQIMIHVMCVVFYNAQAQGLFSDENTVKWVTSVIGSVQSVLAVYGIFSPAPGKPVEPTPVVVVPKEEVERKTINDE